MVVEPENSDTSSWNLFCIFYCSFYQDYRWWWRTFLVSGGSAFYVLIYAIFYFVNKVKSPKLDPHFSDIHNKSLFDANTVDYKWTLFYLLVIHDVNYAVISITFS